jgi:hypothetical protein
VPRYRHTIEVPGYGLPGHLARTRCGRIVAYGRMPNVPRSDRRYCPRCRALDDVPGHRLGDGGDARLLHQLALAQVRLLSDLRSRYAPVEDAAERTVITSPDAVYRLLAPELEPLLQEQLRVLLLDTKHHVLDQVTVYQGTVNHVPVRMAEVFRDAVIAGAPAIVLAHNHPSGSPDPSRDDVALTRDAAKAGELLGIEVLDHVVIGRGRFVSLRQRGVLGSEPRRGRDVYLV